MALRSQLKARVKSLLRMLRTRRMDGKHVKFGKTTKVADNFAVDFMVTPQHRVYVKAGEHSLLNARIVFESPTGSVSIGERCYIGQCTMICREAISIGDDVTIAWNVTIYDHNSHSLDWRQRAKVVAHFCEAHGRSNAYEGLDWAGVASAPIVIGSKAWIGFDVIILKGVTIGEGAVVGAGSVVVGDVEPFTIVRGNPAVPIGRVMQDPTP